MNKEYRQREKKPQFFLHLKKLVLTWEKALGRKPVRCASGKLGLGILIRDTTDISIFIDFFFAKELKHLNFTNLATVGILQKRKGAELPGTAART